MGSTVAEVRSALVPLAVLTQQPAVRAVEQLVVDCSDDAVDAGLRQGWALSCYRKLLDDTRFHNGSMSNAYHS